MFFKKWISWFNIFLVQEVTFFADTMMRYRSKRNEQISMFTFVYVNVQINCSKSFLLLFPVINCITVITENVSQHFL